MFRGYISGGIWGVVVSGIGLGAASLFGPQPAGNQPPASPVVEAPAMPDVTPQTVTSVAAPEITQNQGGAPAPSQTPEVSQPDVGGTQVQIQADTTPLTQPETGEVTANLTSPSGSDGGLAAVGQEEPVLPNPQGAAPMVPGQEQDVVLETTTPAPPKATETEVQVVEVDETTETTAGPDDLVVVAADETAAVEETASEDEAVATETTEPTIEVAEADVTDEATPGPTTSVENDSPLVVTPEIDNPSGGSIVMQNAVTPTENGEVRIIRSGETVDDTIETDADMQSGEADPDTATDNDAPEHDGGETDIAEADATALAQFATPYEGTENKPLMSIILVDDGSLANAVSALSEIPFDITVALDPAAAGAAETMAQYRAAGVEVIALAEVPEGALPTDAEVALEAGFGILSESIGLLDLGQARLQSNIALSDQTMARLAEDGRGFVTLSQGFSTGLRAADTVGVPATVVYRDLDADGQDAQVIRRFLDQAAFRARQQSGVVLVGRVRPDTISALVLWGTANRAAEVSMAPVSAVLLGQ